jgi:uncharacterized protein YndB with AHSA1/START domain
LAGRGDRRIRGEVIVSAEAEAVWEAWTTPDGITSFFAPACNVALEVDGRYEILFAPHAQPGSRGSEDARILALQPLKMLSFTWNAPPHLREVRQQRTHVVVRLHPLSDGQTRVTLVHDGWGEGGEWDQAYEYFVRAWNEVVLPRLRFRFSVGPIDWQNPPDTDDLS